MCTIPVSNRPLSSLLIQASHQQSNISPDSTDWDKDGADSFGFKEGGIFNTKSAPILEHEKSIMRHNKTPFQTKYISVSLKELEKEISEEKENQNFKPYHSLDDMETNVTNHYEIWMEMGQFSRQGRILGCTDNLKEGDQVTVMDENGETEVCILSTEMCEHGTSCFQANPVSTWWHD